MREFNTAEDLVEFIEDENYYYRGKNFETFSELEKECNEYFLTITQDIEDIEEYYSHFGLEVGESYIDKTKTETYFVNQINASVEVYFYEGYIDSGVFEIDYFHGFLINY